MKTRKIADDVLAVLADCGVSGNMLTLPGELDRKLYLRVNDVLEQIGGKWNRKLRVHVFDGVTDLSERLEGLAATGEFVHLDDHGCFYTPDDLADYVIAAAELRPHMSVLEPSAGRGALSSRAIHEVFDPACVFTVELLPENAAHLRSSRVIGGDHVLEGDFLKLDPTKFQDELKFDRVVMNPPFAKQADAKHVLHAWKFVKPGGRLVAIMSAGVAFRTTAHYRAVQELVERHGRVDRNPEGSFKSVGTNVNTVTVVLDKPE
jgi:predicted RNA methylase